jgi:hypothetical protein
MLDVEQIQSNWVKFNLNIEKYISSPRKEKLLNFYNSYEDRIILMPAAHKKEYHNAFPGGYVDHVNRVVECSLRLYEVWKEMGVNTETFTLEELVFSAINHDLGKIGDEHNESYIPQTDNWRREKLGEEYMFNTQLPFASVPDRGLFLLQQNQIQYSFNEMISIQTHDGLYDEGNKKYLINYLPEQKPRTSLPFILHQADLMAARIEFEREWLPKFQEKITPTVQTPILNKTSKTPTRQKALNSIQSQGIKNILDNL